MEIVTKPMPNPKDITMTMKILLFYRLSILLMTSIQRISFEITNGMKSLLSKVYLIWSNCIGAQKEIEKLSFHKKENLVNYPKIHRRSTEAILNYQKPINNEFELTNIPKFKDLKKQIVYTSRKNKINKIERVSNY